MQQLPLDLIGPPAPTLDNFVVGSNTEALTTIRRIAQGHMPARIVVLTGPPGCGKSHLLSALADACATEQHPDRAIRLPDDAAGGAGQIAGRVFIADDVPAWPDAQHQQLFHLINLLRAANDSVLVAACGQPPASLTIRDDLRTRLAAGLVIGLEQLGDEDKAQALRQHARARGMQAGDSIISWLLIHQQRDIRHLIAYLDALDRYSLQTRRQLTLPLLREFDRNHRPGPAPDKLDGRS